LLVNSPAIRWLVSWQMKMKSCCDRNGQGMLNNLGRRESKQHSKGQQPHDPAVSKKNAESTACLFTSNVPVFSTFGANWWKLPWMVLVHEMVGLGGSCGG